MKRLVILRHAKSEMNEAGERDIDRPLNARGRKAARAMGEAFRRLGLSFDQIFASPATRVVQTLDELAKGYGAMLDPMLDERIYLASLDVLFAVVNDAAQDADSILIAGHNPGMERLALHLAEPDEGPDYRQMREGFPTGAFAEIHLPVGSWKAIIAGEGTLRRFIRPADLD